MLDILSRFNPKDPMKESQLTALREYKELEKPNTEKVYEVNGFDHTPRHICIYTAGSLENCTVTVDFQASGF